MRSLTSSKTLRRPLLLAGATLAVAVAFGAAPQNAGACLQCITETSEAYSFCQHHPNGTEYNGCNFSVTCGPETRSPQEIYELECAG
jgi:hypothetical protein